MRFGENREIAGGDVSPGPEKMRVDSLMYSVIRLMLCEPGNMMALSH